MAKLGSLFISLFADTAQFSSGLNKARNDLNSTSAYINRGLASMDKAFTGFGRGIKGAAGEIFSLKGALTALVGTIGLGSIVAMGKQAVEAVGGLGELASQIGVTTDTLQTFRYAATQVGVSQEEMDASLSKLTKTIGMAATGNKAAIDSFNQFGIKILDAQGNVRSTDDVLRDMADSMARLPDPAQRAALATELMGKAGQKMVPFLEGGSAAVDALVQSAKDLGLVFDEETIRRADDAADKLATLSLVMKTQFQAALVELAPILSAFATEMLDVAGAVNRLFQDIAPDDEKGLDALIRKFEKLRDQQDNLVAERDALQQRKSSRSLMDDIFGTDIDSEIKKKETQIAGLTVDLENLQSRIDYKMVDKSEAELDKQLQSALDATGLFGANRNPLAPSSGKSDAEKEVDRAIEKLKQLQAQVAEIGKTGFDLEFAKAIEGLNLQNPGVAALVDKFREAANAIQADKDLTEQLDAAWKAAEASMDAYNKQMEKGKSVTESIRTPVEQLAEKLSDLQQLYLAGAISLKTYNAASAQARKAAEDAAEGTEKYRSAMADLGATFGSAFEEAAIGMDEAGSAAEALGNALEGLLKDIERIILRLAVTDPIAEGLTGLLKGINWASIFGGSSWGSSSAGGGFSQAQFGGSGPSSGGGFFSWLGSIFGFHGGGIAGGTPTFRRNVPMSAFAGAPRLHSGGFIGPGEVPAILKRGEGVFTAEQMARMGPAGGGGATVINITTPPGGSATSQENSGPNGEKQIDILVKDSFDRLAGRGALDRTLGANYGVKRKPSRSV